jgi:hypothetical protein
MACPAEELPEACEFSVVVHHVVESMRDWPAPMRTPELPDVRTSYLNAWGAATLVGADITVDAVEECMKHGER